jgi:hypothetical protein
VGAAWGDLEAINFCKMKNIKMSSNGAATASEHTYVLVTGANRWIIPLDRIGTG